MQSFTDNKGRKWEVSISVTAAKRIKALTGLDLLSDEDGKVFADLSKDIALAVDVLYATVKPEADRLGLTDAEFGESLTGDQIDGAVEAIKEAVVSFIRNPKIRSALREVNSRSRAEVDKRLDLLTKQIQAGAIEAEIAKRLPASGIASTGSPVLSGLTPQT